MAQAAVSRSATEDLRWLSTLTPRDSCSGRFRPAWLLSELQLRSGERLSVEPLKHVVLRALTREAMEDGGPELAIGRDQKGQEVGRQRFSP
jgi:hypothetical protein